MAKTFADLKSDVAAWVHRGDLTSVIPSFVKLAEDEIFRLHPQALRLREMETEETVTITSSVGSLPSDYLEGKSLRFTGAPDSTYLYMPADQWNTYEAGHFTVIGSTIKVPTGASGACTLVYYAEPAALSGDSDTNSVLDGYYGTYLYATLKQAAIYTKSDADYQRYETMMGNAMMNANRKSRAAIGPLTVKAA